MTWRQIGAWSVVGMALLLLAWWSLVRVELGELFLFSLPIDRSPSVFEVRDAAITARNWRIPTLVFLVSLVAVTGFIAKKGPFDVCAGITGQLRALLRSHPKLCLVFVLASLADFLSTIWFFHTGRIDDELHPAIKLFAYAFGPSIGALLGKGLQAFLALWVCSAFPKFGRPLLILLAVAYSVAAVWNMNAGR